MTKKITKLFLITFFTALPLYYFTSFLHCAFEPIPIGARPAGLGGAYTALSDDVYSICYNPAGMALIPRAEFTAQYSQLYVGLWDNSKLSYSFVGLSQPVKFKRDYGTVGLSWLMFNTDDIYKENTGVFSYAKSIGFSGNKSIELGLNFKFLSLIYGKHDYTYDALTDDGNTWSVEKGQKQEDSLFQDYGFNKSAFTFDLGAQYSIFKNYKLGLMLSNITEPNIALDPKQDAKLSRRINFGLAHTGKNYALAIDYMTRQFNETQDYRISVAGEQYFPFGIGLRASIIAGSRELSNIACGFGYKTNSLQIDYALEYPLSGIRGTMGNHKVSLILRFGPIVRMPEETTLLQQKLIATEQKLSDAEKEIQRLKNELEKLLKKPPTEIKPVEPVKPPKPVKPEVPEKPVVPAKPEISNIEQNYQKEYSDYRKLAPTMDFVKRLQTIKSIVEKYRNKNIDISSAEQEYRLLVDEQKTQEKMYKDSMVYYRKMEARGIDKKTKIDLLKRIINKYQPYGIDVSEARNELEKLQK